MVIAILKALMKKDLQALISEKGIEMVHYITDSPFSQYRNRVMFAAVANHKDLFGIAARWGTTLSPVTGRAPVMALGAVSKGWLSKQANMEHLWLMQMTSSNGHLKLVEL